MTKNILIMDDVEDISSTIQDEIYYYGGKNNYNILTASSIKDAINCLGNNNIDIAILDLKLDNISKYSGMRIYSYIRKNSADTKIIIMSGFPLEYIREDLIIELNQDGLNESEIENIKLCYVYKGGGDEDYIDSILKHINIIQSGSVE